MKQHGHWMLPTSARGRCSARSAATSAACHGGRPRECRRRGSEKQRICVTRPSLRPVHEGMKELAEQNLILTREYAIVEKEEALLNRALAYYFEHHRVLGDWVETETVLADDSNTPEALRGYRLGFEVANVRLRYNVRYFHGRRLVHPERLGILHRLARVRMKMKRVQSVESLWRKLLCAYLNCLGSATRHSGSCGGPLRSSAISGSAKGGRGVVKMGISAITEAFASQPPH